MVKFTNMYGFAKQWLYHNGYSILSGDNQILKYDEDIYPLNETILPYIVPGTEKFSEIGKVIKQIHDYNELTRNGLAIYSQKAPDFFNGHRIQYIIKRIDSSKKDMGHIPSYHELYMEKSNLAFRLKGRNAGIFGWGDWVVLRQNKNRNNKYDAMNQLSIFRKAGKIQDKWSPIKIIRAIKKVIIKDLPILMCHEEGKIICLKDSLNEPVIGYVGERGKGKSFGLNALKGRAYRYWNKRIVDLNDYTKEGAAYCLPWNEDSSFHKKLRLLHEETYPLPAIYLTPNFKDVENPLLEEEGVGFKISLSFNEIIQNFESFAKGSELKLGKSEKYLNELQLDLIDCKNIQDIRDVLNEGIKNNILHEKSAMAIYTTLQKLIKEDIMDISNKIPSKWRVIKKDKNGNIESDKAYPPLIAALYAELCPVLVTSGVFDTPHFPQIFRHHASDIFKVQSEDKYFKENQIQMWVFIDEITKIASKKHQTVASDIIQEFPARGRTKRIGMMYATQNYSLLFDTIRQNTNYLFVYNQIKSEGKEIADDFNLSKTDVREIRNMKTFETLACTKDVFATFDEQGVRREEKGPFKGFVLPPLNAHQVPKKIVEIV